MLKRIVGEYSSIINLLLLLSIVGLLPIIDHLSDTQIEQAEQTEQVEQEIESTEQAQSEEITAQTEAATAEKVSLHTLTNEDLLQQFQQILDDLQNRFHITLRILKETEYLLEKAKADTQQVVLPTEPDTKDLNLSSDEADKLLLDYRKAVVAALKQKQTTQEAEKALLDQYNKQLSDAYTDMGNLLQDSKQLDSFSLQVQLRLDDGSLSKDKLLEQIVTTQVEQLQQPITDQQITNKQTQTIEKTTQFLTTQVEQLRQSFTDQQTQLTDKTTQLKEIIDAASKALDETKKSVIDAESAQQTAEDRYGKAQKRQELEQSYAKKSLKVLYDELKGLSEERTWLHSTIMASSRSFMAQRTAEEKIAKELEAMTPPEQAVATDDSTEQTTDNDQYFKDLNTFHKNRLKMIQTRRTALDALVKKGEQLEGDARVLTEHMFKMQVVAEVFERLTTEKGNTEITLSPEMTSEAIKKYDADLSGLLSDASAAVTYANEKLTELTQLQTQSIEAITQAQQSLVNLQKAREGMLAMQKLEADLKKLSAGQVADKFVETAKSLTEKTEALEKERTNYTETETSYVEVTHKLEALQDPFVRELQKQKQGDEYELLKQMYQFAGLEPPTPAVDASATTTTDTAATSTNTTTATSTTAVTPSTPSSVTPATTTPTVATTEATAQAPSTTEETTPVQTATPQPAATTPTPEENPDAAITTYQSQIASWLRITEEQGKQNTEMLDTLKKADEQMSAYLKIADEVYLLTQQQQVTAMEIKKRVGRGELDADKIPDGVTAALKRDQITALETERDQIRNQRLLTQDEIAKLSQVDENLPKVKELFDNTHQFTGKLLDSLQQARKLANDFTLDQSSLSSIEQKTVEQTAARRIRSEDTSLEFFFSFFESPEIGTLTELLQAYYLELIEQERKRDILTKQEEKYNNAIHFLGEEKTKVTELVPLLQTKLTALQTFKEEEMIKAKARIAPDRAQDLMAAFESETGRSLTVLPPFKEEERADGIAYVTKSLFNLDIQIQAIEKWINLFQQRTLPTGIDAEIGQYQDVIAELNTKNAALERHMAGLIGYTREAIKEMTDEEKPKDSKGWARIKSGEIGVLRADRLKMYQENIYVIVIKIALIIVGGIIAILLVNFLIQRSLNRTQRDIDAGKRTDTSLLSVLMLSRKVVKFFIIGTTFILCLDTMGFNTGAVLAGLGIGGIGIAMASKDILSDLFGGITIMVMGLYRIGDLISFKGTWYIVKEIGIRHTMLQDFAFGYRVSMPNGKLVESEIVNISSNPGHIVLKDIHLSTTNNADKLQQAQLLMTEVVKSHEGARFMWVKHQHFDDYSFVFKLYYEIRNFKERHKLENEINVEIVKAFQEHGIKFTPLPGCFPPEVLGLAEKS